jgi:hypothetical protein
MPSEASLERRAKRQSTLRMLELEQQAQDAVDVLLTEDQRRTLIESFQTVKTVFTDLDSFDVEDEEPTPRVPNVPSILSSPPVYSSASVSDSEPENVPSSPPASVTSATIRPTQLDHHTIRRSTSEFVLAHTPPLGVSTPQMPSSLPLDESDRAVRENIDQAAARWKQRGTRSPLRGLFDHGSLLLSEQSPRYTSGSRKRSRSEDPCSDYAHRQRNNGVITGLGMSFGMASDLCSSPSRRGSPSSPPPLRVRSSKRPRLALRSPAKSEHIPGRNTYAMSLDSSVQVDGSQALRDAGEVGHKRKR